MQQRLIVLVDVDLSDRQREAIGSVFDEWMSVHADTLEALPIAWLPYRNDAQDRELLSNAKRGSSSRLEGRTTGPSEVRFSDSVRTARAILAAALRPQPELFLTDLPMTMSHANRAISAVSREGSVHIWIVLATSGAGTPFGVSAGADPRLRNALLGQVEIALAQRGKLYPILIGGPETDLGELVDLVRARLGTDRERGAVAIIDQAEEPEDGAAKRPGDFPQLQSGLRRVLSQIEITRLRDVGLINMTSGILAEGVEFWPGGRFGGTITLGAGRNQLRVRVLLSDGRKLAQGFEREFDYSLIKEVLLERERARIRAYRERRGELSIEAEE
jgi:hypothetical protein